MGLEILVELEDRVRINAHLSNGSNIPDEDVTLEVLYSSIPNLSAPSTITDDDRGCGESREWWEYVHIPKVNRVLAYKFSQWMETSFSTMQSVERSPYLVPESDSAAKGS